MSVSGSLKVRKLVDILKELREEESTGILNIKSYYGVGTICLKGGKVAMASSSKSTEKLGRKLIELGMVTEVQVQKALKVQKEKPKGTHLGDVLVELGFIDNIDLEKLIIMQIKEVIYGMNFWEDGFFRFDPNLDKNIPSTILFDPKNLAEDEIEQFLKDTERETDQENAREKQQKAASIKGEIAGRLEALSSKLRAFKPKEVVLLVEDEMLMRQIITDKLNTFGFEVESVPTPKDAVEKLGRYEEQGIYPVVVTDLVMPTISGKGMFGGMELLEIIQEKFPHVPVIMTTAYPDPGTKQKALFWGVYYYIAKPDRSKAKPDELTSLFDNYMEELSLSIENIIRRREVHFEKDHLNIIRNELVEELFSTKLELSAVEKTMETKVDELGFLKATSDLLIKDRNVNSVSEKILSYASKELDRAIIFLTRKGEYVAFNGVSNCKGCEGDTFKERLKGLTIPMESVDVIRTVAEKQEPFEGRVDPTLLPMLKKIGNEIPEKIVVLPMIVEGRVAGILYGDTLPGTPPCRSVDAMMILLNLASLSLEITHMKQVVAKTHTA